MVHYHASRTFAILNCLVMKMATVFHRSDRTIKNMRHTGNNAAKVLQQQKVLCTLVICVMSRLPDKENTHLVYPKIYGPKHVLLWS